MKGSWCGGFREKELGNNDCKKHKNHKVLHRDMHLFSFQNIPGWGRYRNLSAPLRQELFLVKKVLKGQDEV